MTEYFFLFFFLSESNSPEGQGFCQAGFSADFVKVFLSPTEHRNLLSYIFVHLFFTFSIIFYIYI